MLRCVIRMASLTFRPRLVARTRLQLTLLCLEPLVTRRGVCVTARPPLRVTQFV